MHSEQSQLRWFSIMAVLSSHQEREVLKRILSGSNWNVNVLSRSR